ncbi:MAG: hypothetical protein J5672_00045 [Verrucomicrobia bacterium]|nr:hypothetical protein [Verrucomicrobiota bacterium]
MQKLEKIIESLIKAVCIFLLSLIVFGLIGIVCLNVYNDLTWESRNHPRHEYIKREHQLQVMFLHFYYDFETLEENDPADFGTNEFKNLFEIKKLLLEPEDNEKLREKSKYLYLNPDIDLWRQALLCSPRMVGGKEFEGENEIAVILCDPEGICNNKFPAASFLGCFTISANPINSVPVEWLEPNAEAQKEWEAYERSLSEAGVK